MEMQPKLAGPCSRQYWVIGTTVLCKAGGGACKGGNTVYGCGGSVTIKAGKTDMKNIAVIAGIGLMAVAGIGAELPVCSEFHGEDNIRCVSNDSMAVIASRSMTGSSYEFFKGGRKAYLELGADGSILASSGFRTLRLETIPADSVGRYVEEVLDGILGDISWQ